MPEKKYTFKSKNVKYIFIVKRHKRRPTYIISFTFKRLPVNTIRFVLEGTIWVF